VRLQICTGLFRSTTNLQAFENMLAILSRSARLQGPETPGPNGGVPAAARPAPAPAAPPGAPPRRLGGLDMPLPDADPEPERGPGEHEVQLPKVTVRRDTPKVGRNDPCPCGSGKKYKHCHGK